MSDFAAALAVSPQLAAPLAAPTATELAKRGQIKDTAQKFEVSFVSSMLQQMFDGLDTDGPFGGGQGEAMFRSLLTEAMAKQVVKAGGIGVSGAVQREMLKMQGLA